MARRLLSTDASRVLVAPLAGAGKLRPVVMDKAPRAVLGCIQIPTDYVLDHEGPQMLEQLPGVELRLQKMEFDSDAIAADTYLRAAPNVRRAAATLMPAERCTVVGRR